MSKDIANLDHRRQLATQERLWLLHLVNGTIQSWTPILATNKAYVDCLQDGTPVNPGDVPGNHPWIRSTSVDLKKRLGYAGAEEDDIEEFGRILTERGTEKFKALNYDKAKAMLEHSNPDVPSGATIRIHNKINRMCEDAKADLRWFSNRIRIKLGLITVDN